MQISHSKFSWFSCMPYSSTWTPMSYFYLVLMVPLTDLGIGISKCTAWMMFQGEKIILEDGEFLSTIILTTKNPCWLCGLLVACKTNLARNMGSSHVHHIYMHIIFQSSTFSCIINTFYKMLKTIYWKIIVSVFETFQVLLCKIFWCDVGQNAYLLLLVSCTISRKTLYL